MKHVYLFSDSCRASSYGIGSYLKQLKYCFKDDCDICLNIVYLHSNEKEFLVINDDGVRVFRIPYSYYIIRKYEDRYYRNVYYLLSPYIEKEEILLFHFNYYTQAPLVFELKKHFVCSSIFTVHYQDWTCFLNGDTSLLYKLFAKDKKNRTKFDQFLFDVCEKEKKILQQMDKIVCLSKKTQSLLENIFEIDSRKIVIIYNAIECQYPTLSDNGKISQKREFHIPAEEKVILYVGRLDKLKNVRLLISAFKELVKEFENCTLILVGDGKFSTYQKQAFGCWSKILFTGFVTKEQLACLYQIADIGVIPSLSEQCSYVLLEMMSYGIPVIGLKETGVDELLALYSKGIILNLDKEEDQFENSSLKLKVSIVKYLFEYSIMENIVPNILLFEQTKKLYNMLYDEVIKCSFSGEMGELSSSLKWVDINKKW